MSDIDLEHAWIRLNIVQITLEKMEWGIELDGDDWDGSGPYTGVHTFKEALGFHCNACSIDIEDVTMHFLNSHRVEGMCEGCDRFVGKGNLRKVLRTEGSIDYCEECK